MARITLMGNRYTRISEGFHTLYIYDVKYDENFGQLEIYCFSETTGETHREKYYLMQKDSAEPNENAIVAFSFLAWTALNDFESEDIDPVSLIGHRFNCTVQHDLATNGKTYVRLNDKVPYDGETLANPWETSDFRKSWEAKNASAEAVEEKPKSKKAEAKPAPKAEPEPAAESDDTEGMDAILAALDL